MVGEPDPHDTKRRADARRNAASILDAATRCLARDPDVSLKEIAAEAGVGRVTLYGHYETRTALVDAVVDRAISQSESDLKAVDLSGDPAEAMSRLIGATWDLTHRFGALVVAAERTLPAERLRVLHHEPAARVRELLNRGRKAGIFRSDMPAEWQITAIQALVHAGVEAAYRDELTPDQARKLVPRTVLGALTQPERVLVSD
ncbi:TetR/AcrR family transcriptional regulator [Tessaracoccus sp. OS52]|uniref:TetR/AcrR family transcriptional regulator n=1 Tax=Tessaracoccus sp. OS52 TaxID=2886691 RepID=UPI001D10FE40|nr:TetR/AcrR family transcriptional regulator [Tessaracoccus sp. OS52]MCC2593936.1 TetR/AcrR family transcriptional regulator [Tessaracoccus sp. OS52]